MPLLVLTADTHVPKRARDLPAALWAAVDAADLVVHAGDWVSPELLDALSARAPVLGVWGNNDGAELRARLPEVAVETVGGVRLAVVHETGATPGREARMDRRYADAADLLVFGHSHVPWDTTTPRGLRLVNPGSPTDRRRQPYATFATLTLDAGEVRDLVWHRL